MKESLSRDTLPGSVAVSVTKAKLSRKPLVFGAPVGSLSRDTRLGRQVTGTALLGHVYGGGAAIASGLHPAMNPMPVA